MTLTNWLLAAAGIWGLALTWMWAFAAQNQATTEALNTNRPPMMREFGSGDMKDFMNPEKQLENITANLSDSDKAAVEELLTQYREEEKAFHESVEKATESIKEEFETTKTAIKEKIVAITWESDEVNRLFDRGGCKGHWKGMGMMPWMMPDFANFSGSEAERPELPNFDNGERPELPNFDNGERPELPNFDNGERPELPEMNWERPQFWGPRGMMKQPSQGEQQSK